MIFKSDKVAAHWDIWCYYHDGTYYLYYLITECSPGEGIGVATSEDGVHWEDHGWCIRQSDKNIQYLGSGDVWKSPDFEKTGKFICNYSEHRKDGSGKITQNILFAWSTDLIHWTICGDEMMFKVDTQYYAEEGRWDNIFAFPREEGGYWGAWTATGITVKDIVGIGYSEDGVAWKALPAPIVKPGANEVGALYPINDRIYAMFGAPGGMWAYSADKVTGPYVRSPKNAHLLNRNHAYFSRFLDTPDGLLVVFHQMSGVTLSEEKLVFGRKREVTFVSPFKVAEIDQEGIMRWKYWKGNEALKGKVLKVIPPSSGDIQMITDELDLNTGIVVEANIILPENDGQAPTLIYKTEDKHYALRIFSRGVVEMGTVDSSGKNWEKIHSADREWDFNKSISLRVLLRAGMMEVYLDDHFMECWTMGCYGNKGVTLGVMDGEKHIENLNIWQMSLLPAVTESGSG